MKIKIEKFTIEGIELTDGDRSFPALSEKKAKEMVDELFSILDLDEQIDFIDKIFVNEMPLTETQSSMLIKLSIRLHYLRGDLIGKSIFEKDMNTNEETTILCEEFINEVIKPKFPKQAIELLESMKKLIIQEECNNKKE